MSTAASHRAPRAGDPLRKVRARQIWALPLETMRVESSPKRREKSDGYFATAETLAKLKQNVSTWQPTRKLREVDGVVTGLATESSAYFLDKQILVQGTELRDLDEGES